MNILGFEITIKKTPNKLSGSDKVKIFNQLVRIYNKNTDCLTVKERALFIQLIDEIQGLTSQQLMRDISK